MVLNVQNLHMTLYNRLGRLCWVCLCGALCCQKEVSEVEDVECLKDLLRRNSNDKHV